MKEKVTRNMTVLKSILEVFPGTSYRIRHGKLLEIPARSRICIACTNSYPRTFLFFAVCRWTSAAPQRSAATGGSGHQEPQRLVLPAVFGQRPPAVAPGPRCAPREVVRAGSGSGWPLGRTHRACGCAARQSNTQTVGGVRERNNRTALGLGVGADGAARYLGRHGADKHPHVLSRAVQQQALRDAAWWCNNREFRQKHEACRAQLIRNTIKDPDAAP